MAEEDEETPSSATDDEPIKVNGKARRA